MPKIKDKNLIHQFPLSLQQVGKTIRRHVKIKSEATPFNPLYKNYFKQRENERNQRKTISNLENSAGLRIVQPY